VLGIALLSPSYALTDKNVGWGKRGAPQQSTGHVVLGIALLSPTYPLSAPDFSLIPHPSSFRPYPLE
jgi:hypothetical protein